MKSLELKPLTVLGKRSLAIKESTKIGLTEKHSPYEIAEKMRKKDKRKSIFTKPKQFCTCTGKKKKCNLPRKK